MIPHQYSRKKSECCHLLPVSMIVSSGKQNWVTTSVHVFLSPALKRDQVRTHLCLCCEHIAPAIGSRGVCIWRGFVLLLMGPCWWNVWLSTELGQHFSATGLSSKMICRNRLYLDYSPNNLAKKCSTVKVLLWKFFSLLFYFSLIKKMYFSF